MARTQIRVHSCGHWTRISVLFRRRTLPEFSFVFFTLSTAGISLRRTNSAGLDVVLLRVSWMCSFLNYKKKVPEKSIWKVNGTRLTESFHWKVSKTSSISIILQMIPSLNQKLLIMSFIFPEWLTWSWGSIIRGHRRPLVTNIAFSMDTYKVQNVKQLVKHTPVLYYAR